MSDLSELFARDPLELSKQDINSIVVKLRSQRERFVAGNKSAGTPAVRQTAASKARDAALEIGKNLTFDLDGL